MKRDWVALQLAQALNSHRQLLLAVVPGLIVTSLHATMLLVPRADFVDALDSDRYRIQWITGAYILGSAAGMALARFLGSRLGLRGAFLLGLALFTLAGAACAGISAVVWMAPLRLFQGGGNGLVISVGMVLIWRGFLAHKELAMALYGMSIFVPAVAGAALGGLLTTAYSWRLIFALLLPLGTCAGLVAWRLLPPDLSRRPAPAPLDVAGFALLLALVTTMSVVLDMGQYWGWLASPQFAPWFAAFLVSLIAFVLWGVLARTPAINLRPLATPHFALGVVVKALFTCNLFTLVSLLAGYMVSLRGYQWWQASLVMAPTVLTMPLGMLAGALSGSHRNRKLRMFAGLAVMTAATGAFATLDLYTAGGVQSAYLALWGLGAGLVVGPALLTAFEGLSTDETLHTAGVFNVLRSLPAFVVGACVATLLTRGTDAQFDVLRQDVHINRPIVTETFRRSERYFGVHGGNLAGKQAHAALGKWVHSNARVFALQGIFQYLALVPALGMVLVLLMRVPIQD